MGNPARAKEEANQDLSRREALAALARYSAVLGGAAATVVSADSLVSAASAYPAACDRDPTLPACPGGVPPGRGKKDRTSASQRVLF